jgi:putative nucleotidyltransferase with HDIG domain
VPAGYRAIATSLLSGLRELPCDVYISTGGHALLYTTVGSDAIDVIRRVDGECHLLIRAEDHDLFRRFLAAGLRGILADDSLDPTERSRRAYAISTEVVSPLFTSPGAVNREGLTVTQDVIDSVSEALLEGNELVWAIVARMQKHLTTHTHAINTAIYAVVLAQYLRLGEREDVLDTGRGALLHDIGKTRISARILDKPGKLSRTEWRIIQTHPTAGVQLVARALGTLPGYGHIIAEHHERADGSGYPGGRRSSQVALDSQLVAIVDAFDALTSTRSYKATATPFEALRTMRFDMAGQFNDELLQEFIGLLGGWQELRRGDLHELGSGVASSIAV